MPIDDQPILNKVHRTLTISHYMETQEITIDCPFSTFEALGLLEAAKALVVHAWYERSEDQCG